MNREVKFSRFVGIAIVIICIWIVVLALMSAILKSENNDNMIYVDDGKEVILDMPKSNIISNCIDIKKEEITVNGVVEVMIKLPKINIDTEAASNINRKIYSIYEDKYSELLKSADIQKIDIDYAYEYLRNDTIIEITVIIKMIKNNKIEEIENKFSYDIINNKEVTE